MSTPGQTSKGRAIATACASIANGAYGAGGEVLESRALPLAVPQWWGPAKVGLIRGDAMRLDDRLSDAAGRAGGTETWWLRW